MRKWLSRIGWVFFIITQAYVGISIPWRMVNHHMAPLDVTLVCILFLTWWMVMLSETEWYKKRTAKGKDDHASRSSSR